MNHRVQPALLEHFNKYLKFDIRLAEWKEYGASSTTVYRTVVLRGFTGRVCTCYFLPTTRCLRRCVLAQFDAVQFSSEETHRMVIKHNNPLRNFKQYTDWHQRSTRKQFVRKPYGKIEWISQWFWYDKTEFKFPVSSESFVCNLSSTPLWVVVTGFVSRIDVLYVLTKVPFNRYWHAVL